MNLSKI